MTRARTLTGSTALGLVFLATSAAADLTAADVWGDWRSYMQGMGYVVTATETARGDTLAVTGIAVALAPDAADGQDMTMTLGSLEFVEASDGTVEVVMPDTIPVTIRMTNEELGQPATINMTYTQSGQRMIASGTPEAMQYDYSADSFAVALSNLSLETDDEEAAAAAESARFTLSGQNLLSTTGVTVAQVRQYVQNMTFDNFVYDAFFQSPDGPDQMALNLTANKIELGGTSALPADPIASAGDITAMLDAGFAFDGTIRSEGAQTNIDLTGSDGQSKITTGSANATFGVAMTPDGIRYDIASQEVAMAAQFAGFPLPLSASMAQSGFTLRAPVLKGEDAQDFALGFNLTELDLPDMIWGMVDPQGQLPHDPATVALDLTGKVKLLYDFLDPQVAANMAPGTVPGEIERVTINDLTVDAVGAEVNATGDVAFDNTDKTTLPGFPKPVGEINIDLAGANALLEKLAAMGLIPADQAMGARMMMGLFAVPGDAPDTLKSTITFSEDGRILANGQQIR
ncbi:DUF2125 domain-containing protein [Sulfitobacter sp. HNIBRBA3233]|uniref:DUF2125 domain-containing protein n=1 Tax=Sulfitobacter marinivivus TaxID=3158558 RepID=UPI0032DF5C5C